MKVSNLMHIGLYILLFFFFWRINGRFGLYIAETYIFLLISNGNVVHNRGMGMGNSCMEMKITFFKKTIFKQKIFFYKKMMSLS